MSEPITIYTVKGRNFPNVWEFHYDLEGFLVSWLLIDGQLTDKQREWLFNPSRFPYTEDVIKVWKTIKNIDVIVGQPDLSFDVFYNIYKYKVKRVTAEKAWKKLSKADRLEAIAGVKRYDGHLQRKHGQSKANPATYLNQRYWEDQYGAY